MKTWTIILNWFGVYTTKQYNALLRENKLLSENNVELRRQKNSNQIYTNQLLKEHKRKIDPFDFDGLIKLYDRRKLNALSYKIINHVRNTPELRDLLEIWAKRGENAKRTIDSNKEKDLNG